MYKDFIERFNKEDFSEKDFWNLFKRFGIVLLVFFVGILLINTAGCSQKVTNEDQEAVNELQKEQIKYGDDGVNGAIAPDEDMPTGGIRIEDEDVSPTAMVAMSVEDSGRSDPFLPSYERVIKPKAGPSMDLLPPPETITVDETAKDVITTKVSGIMYDSKSPSAILNIKGSDYLVRSGDVINGYRILAIARDNVTVKNGANIYKAGVGEMFSSDGINYNTISNLEGKFGGRKNSANKR